MKVNKIMVCVDDRYDTLYDYLTLYKSYHITDYDPNDETVLLENNLGKLMWTGKKRFIDITDFRKMQISKIKERING